MVQPKSKFSSMSPETVRIAILVTLVVQNSAQALFMRYSFKPKEYVEGEEREPEPASATAVVMAELCKLICSICLQYREDGGVRQLSKTLRQDVWEKPKDQLKMAVPACLYVVQNNLNYIAVSNLDGPTFQLLYQLKILTTALFSVFMLKRVLLLKQWGALAMLAIGVGLVQVSTSSSQDKGDTKGESGDRQEPLVGLVAVLMACCTSGFAGVYFEKVLKGTSVSLWVRNMQLSTFGVLLGLGCVWYKDGEAVSTNGFFYGYNYAVWMAVLLNSLGGLVVAMVVKYADNVIKGFATSVSIVLTALVSFFLFGFSISFMFVIGAYLVLHSTFLYSQKPQNSGAASSNGSGGSSSAAGGGGGGGGGIAPSSGGSSGGREDAGGSPRSKGEVELPEQESLLKSESTASPRAGRGQMAAKALPRKNGSSKFAAERDLGPV